MFTIGYGRKDDKLLEVSKKRDPSDIDNYSSYNKSLSRHASTKMMHQNESHKRLKSISSRNDITYTNQLSEDISVISSNANLMGNFI